MRKRGGNPGLLRGWLPAAERKSTGAPKLLGKRADLGRPRKKSKSVKSLWEMWREGSQTPFDPSMASGTATYMDADDSVLQELATILDILYPPPLSPKLLLSPRFPRRTNRLKPNPLIHTAASYGLIHPFPPLTKPLLTSKSSPKPVLSHRKV